ncbi:MAG: prolipoprotein diacylglyceryl transferase [Rickettsiales bacterium]
MLTFPTIDPILIQLGPLAIRWYSLAYVGGILLGWWVLARELAVRPLQNLNKKAFDDMIVWAVLGIILGGRLGYVFFYKPDYYLFHPLEILYVWEGGMSFHGGFLGFVLAFYLFCKKHKVRFLALMDLMACVAPIGIGLGRLANFINAELYGRVTDSPLGMVFPHSDGMPRHPSQLYEATLEGLLLFAIMMFLLKCTTLRNHVGKLSGLFCIGYGSARIICEFFREPDPFLGFLFAGATMGQLLSLPLIAVGIYLLVRKSI